MANRALPQICLIFMALFVVTSCDFINTEILVATIHPAGTGQIIQDSDRLWVDFSIPPDHNEAERLFSLTTGQSSCGGDFVWVGQRLTFQPVPALTPGIRYVLKFSGSLHTADGRVFQVNKSSSFSFVSATTPTQLVSWSPSDGQTLGTQAPLVLQFSRPMDRDSVVSGFSISPSTGFIPTWNSDATQLTISPTIAWNNLSNYRWSVQKTFHDAEGRNLLEDYQHEFIAITDSIAPQIIGVSVAQAVTGAATVQYLKLSSDLSTLTNADAIMVESDEALKPESVANAIRLNPTIKGHVLEQHTGSVWQYIFVPDDSFQPNTPYTLTIGTGCSDLAGNLLITAINRYFTPNIPWFMVSKIVVSSNGFPDVTIPLPDAPGTNSLITVEKPLNRLTIHLEFDFGTGAQGFSLSDRLQFATLAECSHVFPALVTVKDPSLVTVSFPNEHCCELTWEGFSIGTATQPHYFRFRLPGGSSGIRTSTGLWMKEDVCFVFTPL